MYLKDSENQKLLIERLSYRDHLGINIYIARKYICEPPLTQLELAEVLDRSQHYVSDLENGNTYPSPEELEIIAKLAGLRSSEIRPPYNSY